MDGDNIVNVKSKKSDLFIPIFCALLLILFVLGLTHVYEKGFYDGSKAICGDLDLGVSQGNYLCYNASETIKTPSMAQIEDYFNNYKTKGDYQ